MPRILIPILALATFATLSACCLGLVGCGERISPEEYAELNALTDTIVAQHETLKATIEGILSYIPCPPCPDTVYLYRYPDEVIKLRTQMPPGTWVSKDTLCLWITGSDCGDMEVRIYGIEVDSVFIPRKE